MNQGMGLFWGVVANPEIAPRNEIAVETITFVGISVEESSETWVFERWCKMGFVHPQY